jgi:hypothetical protein
MAWMKSNALNEMKRTLLFCEDQIKEAANDKFRLQYWQGQHDGMEKIIRCMGYTINEVMATDEPLI